MNKFKLEDHKTDGSISPIKVTDKEDLEADKLREEASTNKKRIGRFMSLDPDESSFTQFTKVRRQISKDVKDQSPAGKDGASDSASTSNALKRQTPLVKDTEITETSQEHQDASL